MVKRSFSNMRYTAKNALLGIGLVIGAFMVVFDYTKSNYIGLLVDVAFMYVLERQFDYYEDKVEVKE